MTHAIKNTILDYRTRNERSHYVIGWSVVTISPGDNVVSFLVFSICSSAFLAHL